MRFEPSSTELADLLLAMPVEVDMTKTPPHDERQRLKIPAQLRSATGGEGELEVEGSTVGEALDAVFDHT